MAKESGPFVGSDGAARGTSAPKGSNYFEGEYLNGGPADAGKGGNYLEDQGTMGPSFDGAEPKKGRAIVKG